MTFAVGICCLQFYCYPLRHLGRRQKDIFSFSFDNRNNGHRLKNRNNAMTQSSHRIGAFITTLTLIHKTGGKTSDESNQFCFKMKGFVVFFSVF